MTTTEERSALERWRTQRDGAALTRLLHAQRPMIERLAAAFADGGVAGEDLVQEGFVGLLTAIRRFDFRRRNRLADYAQHWVRLQMLRFTVAAADPAAAWSLDDHRRRRRLDALVDPAPGADEQLAGAEELRAQAARLQEALASMSARERAVLEARHLGDDVRAPEARLQRVDADAERRALAKLFVRPSERTTRVDVLIGGRRQRLSAVHP